LDHLKRVEQEFTRQADTFDKYAASAGGNVTERFQAAIGAAGDGVILDVACGPGIVTAAMAGRAKSVIAFDATPAMLDRARKRCAGAGLDNVRFEQGDAAAMPFDAAAFDGIVTRLAVHHFLEPGRVLAEMYRVLRPGGILVIADVISSENADEAALHNAIEVIRDPSHIRMLPASELTKTIAEAGYEIIQEDTWDKWREFEEWMRIANDPQRVDSLRTVTRALAEDGRTAGIGLSIRDDEIVFFHRWKLVTARKPTA